MWMHRCNNNDDWLHSEVDDEQQMDDSPHTNTLLIHPQSIRWALSVRNQSFSLTPLRLVDCFAIINQLLGYGHSPPAALRWAKGVQEVKEVHVRSNKSQTWTTTVNTKARTNNCYQLFDETLGTVTFSPCLACCRMPLSRSKAIQDVPSVARVNTCKLRRLSSILCTASKSISTCSNCEWFYTGNAHLQSTSSGVSDPSHGAAPWENHRPPLSGGQWWPQPRWRWRISSALLRCSCL